MEGDEGAYIKVDNCSKKLRVVCMVRDQDSSDEDEESFVVPNIRIN